MNYNGLVFRIADIKFNLNDRKHTVYYVVEAEKIAARSREKNADIFPYVLVDTIAEGVSMLRDDLKKHLCIIGGNLKLDFDLADFEFRVSYTEVHSNKFRVVNMGVIGSYFPLVAKKEEDS